MSRTQDPGPSGHPAIRLEGPPRLAPMPTRTERRRGLLGQPARFVVGSFMAAIGVGTLLLSLPVASAPGRSTSFVEAAFTACSAVTVTGLVVVDTGSHFSAFGQVVVLALIEVGGLGFMTIASLIVLAVSKRLGLRQRMVARTERASLTFGEVRNMLLALARVTFTLQAAIAVLLTVRLVWGHDYSLGSAAWHGAFHSVSAFNNAGFSLWSDSMTGFSGDWMVLLPVMVSIVVGGLGFPVLADLDARLLRPENPGRRSVRQRWHSLTLHSKVTLATSGALLAAGVLVFTTFEWGNPGTLGPMPLPEKLLNGTFASVTPRTAGFNTVDVSAMQPQSLLATIALMFIGAGSAGTSGGIKVGTFAILALVIWSQLRGERDVTGFRRRIPDATQRQAITVALLAVAVVMGATSVLLVSARSPLGDAAFEAVSAFGTVGLSTGITPELPAADLVVLMVLMLVGRVGPITLGAALVLRTVPSRSRPPEEAPLIG